VLFTVPFTRPNRSTHLLCNRARSTHPPVTRRYLPFIQPFTASRSVSQFTSTLHRIAHRLSHLVSVHAAFCSVLWMGINRPLRLAIRQGTSPPPPPSPAAPNPYRRPYLASYAAHSLLITYLPTIPSPYQPLDPLCNRARSSHLVTQCYPHPAQCHSSSPPMRIASVQVIASPTVQLQSLCSAPVTMFSSSHLVSVHAAFCSVLWMGINRPLRLAIRQGIFPPPLLARRT
jgi:hypothetical protein